VLPAEGQTLNRCLILRERWRRQDIRIYWSIRWRLYQRSDIRVASDMLGLRPVSFAGKET